MSEAIFALLGAIVGALGAVAGDLLSSARDDRRTRREALRSAVTDFAAAISAIRHLSYRVEPGQPVPELERQFHDAHATARMQYERLRLLTSSEAAQEAARYALRHAYNTWTVARRTSRRMDEYAVEGPWEQSDRV